MLLKALSAKPAAAPKAQSENLNLGNPRWLGWCGFFFLEKTMTGTDVRQGHGAEEVVDARRF
ncbi:MAG: hypothetical protein ACRECW_11280 [Phyllobacterium sp.]